MGNLPVNPSASASAVDQPLVRTTILAQTYYGKHTDNKRIKNVGVFWGGGGAHFREKFNSAILSIGIIINASKFPIFFPAFS